MGFMARHSEWPSKCDLKAQIKYNPLAQSIYFSGISIIKVVYIVVLSPYL
jgi:hypothetical protein